MIKIFTGWSNPGGSTTAFINLCNLFNNNGHECIMYGPHDWHLDKCNGAKLQTATTKESDKVIYHFLHVRKTRPNVDKFILSLHEKDLYPLKQTPVHIFDKIHFLNKQQLLWHEAHTIKNLSWFICGNVNEDLKPCNKPKQKIAGIIGSIDKNKQVHVSIERAIKDGHTDIRIYGTINDPDYYESDVRPVIEKYSKQVKLIGYVEEKQTIYDTITDVYHSSLSENASLVSDECKLTDVSFHGNENIIEQSLWSNVGILKIWRDQLEL